MWQYLLSAEFFVASTFRNGNTKEKYIGLERKEHLNARVGSVADCVIMVLILPKHRIDEMCA